MKKKRQQTRRPEPKRGRTYLMMVVCGAVLASGFFFAARQHFASMDYGMRNSRLRKQVDDLEAEKRRLILARENSMSPGEIKKAAKRTGLVTAAPEATLAQVASTTKDKAVPPTTATATAKPMIVKTASVAAIQPTMNAELIRPERIVKQVKKPTGAN
jgi:hypothetical protein